MGESFRWLPGNAMIARSAQTHLDVVHHPGQLLAAHAVAQISTTTHFGGYGSCLPRAIAQQARTAAAFHARTLVAAERGG